MAKPRKGTPWSKIFADFVMPPEILHKIGKFLVRQVVLEAKKEKARQKGRRPGDPVGLPSDKKFFDSFSYKVTGDKVSLTSDWEGFSDLIDGKKPYPMKWLKSTTRTPLIVPLREQGTNQLIFRMAPLKAGDYWVHPGIAKHSFLEKAKDKTAEEAKRLFIEYLGTLLKEGDPSK